MLESSQPPADPATYARMAAAIAFMCQPHPSPPDLAAIAAHVQLSPTHLQRLFTQWVGISPKRFGQHLTLAAAQARIAQTPNLLELTATVGLSSPGRLHDLFVTLVAMTPGDYKAGGQGLVLQYGVHSTAFGWCLIALTSRGISQLEFLDVPPTTPATAWPTLGAERLRQQWPAATLHYAPAVTQPLSDRLWQPLSTQPLPVALHVKGTNFQLQVWRALLAIPAGGVVTYQQVAAAIGKPTAARAVGTAIGQNPIAGLIPCHRVIRASGAWGGYRWGITRKAALLGWEAVQIEAESGKETADGTVSFAMGGTGQPTGPGVVRNSGSW